MQTVFGTTIEQNYALIKKTSTVRLNPSEKKKPDNSREEWNKTCPLLCINSPAKGVISWWTYYRVDAVSEKNSREMLRRLKSQGITILVSTPYMDEASLATESHWLQNGSILSINTPQAVTSVFGENFSASNWNDVYAPAGFAQFFSCKKLQCFWRILSSHIERYFPMMPPVLYSEVLKKKDISLSNLKRSLPKSKIASSN